MLIYLFFIILSCTYADDSEVERNYPKRDVPLKFVKLGISLDVEYCGIEILHIQVKEEGTHYNLKYLERYETGGGDSMGPQVSLWSYPVSKIGQKFDLKHAFKICEFNEEDNSIILEAHNGFKANIKIDKKKIVLNLNIDKKKVVKTYELLNRDERIDQIIKNKYETEAYWRDGKFPVFDRRPIKYKIELLGDILKIGENQRTQLNIPENIELSVYKESLLIMKTKNDELIRDPWGIEKTSLYDSAIIFITQSKGKMDCCSYTRCLNTGVILECSEEDINILLKSLAHDPVLELHPGLGGVHYLCIECKRKKNHTSFQMATSCPRCKKRTIHARRHKMCFGCSALMNECMLCGKRVK